MKKECVLGVDFDGVLVNDVIQMKAKFSGKYASRLYEMGTPDRKLEPDFWRDRRDFLKNRDYISDLLFWPGAKVALPLASKFFDETYINSARWTYQGLVIGVFLKRHNLSGYISSVLLRSEEDEDPLEVKLRNARRAGITHMVEDDASLALAFAKNGIKVALIDRPWNQWVPNSPNIRRYLELWDFAMDIAYHGSVKGVFVRHEGELEEDSANLDKVYRRDPSCTDRFYQYALGDTDDFYPCALRKICFVALGP